MAERFSEETSEIIRDYMYSVVEEGTGASAAVEGYDIGGKTGTAEKHPRGKGNYLVSFIGYAPQENPQVMVYVVIDEPNASIQSNSGFRYSHGGGHHGGDPALPGSGEDPGRGVKNNLVKAIIKL